MSYRETYLQNTSEECVRIQLFAPSDTVLLALSGGPDSVFLAYLLHEMRLRIPFRLHAVHVNHHLRGERSDADQRFVEQLCARMEIPVKIFHADVKTYARTSGLSVEMAARQVRHTSITGYADELNANQIATAHTADDRVETAVMRFVTGAGLQGLTGLRAVRRVSSSTVYVRPIIRCWKSDILTWLKDNGKHYCIDESNFSDDYLRNRVRNRLIPDIERTINPDFKKTLFANLDLLQGQSEVFQAVVDDTHAKAILRSDFLQVFDKPILAAAHPAVVSGIILKSIYTLAAEDPRITYAHLAAIVDNMGTSHKKIIRLPAGLIGLIDRSYVIIALETVLSHFFEYIPYRAMLRASDSVSPVQVSAVPVEMSYTCCSLQDNADCQSDAHQWHGLVTGNRVVFKALVQQQYLERKCYIRFRKPGDIIKLSGGRKKLKKYLIDKKVPVLVRNFLPLIESDGTVIWIAGMPPVTGDAIKSAVGVEISLKI